MDRSIIADAFRDLQDRICAGLRELDKDVVLTEDLWEREDGGGRTRVLADGDVFEKGGVNFSEVHGHLPKGAAAALNASSGSFFATGVSIVIHPFSPMVPIIHMNVRYFELDSGEAWFGGGIDLTPIYFDREEADKFHASIKTVCDDYSTGSYKEFSAWADEYFTIKHRKESRGIGGIFFDRIGNDRGPMEDTFKFVLEVGNAFVPIYSEVVNKKRELDFGPEQKEWQSIRRGRYVEFNLVQDRGTRFGLETGGRTESILMSLPKNASWLYAHEPEPGSEEEKTLIELRARAK